ncbi:hypothetical protein VTL71DRAFT_14549 [Oculimacula yallundae]|uniref:SAM domain-containing protein n=1 Tax=Oculimacula yallundae TaxID=86028 RepID=A0ABR4CIR6_9HELO
MAAELEKALMDLGLEEYLVRFQESGFKDWESLSKIAESQLSHLDVRLGHRRRLQRAIARGRLWPEDTPLPLGPDLNQRVRDWLYEEVYAPDPEESEFSEAKSKPQTSSSTAPMQGVAIDQGHGSQSSSENSSVENVYDGAKVLHERKSVSTSSSSSAMVSQGKPESVDKGVT